MTGPPDPAPPPRWAAWLPHLWSVLLPLLMLGPALGRGYLLSYDMVWVPDLAMRSDFVGGGEGLPRAVPSDAVVAVLDNLVPGMVLQKVVLLGALVLAAQGAQRLVPSSTTARLVAVSLTVWNPFVVERLWIGHWPVLLGYAVLPWLVLLLRDRTRRLSPALCLLVPLGCLGASAGVVTALVLLVVGLRRRDHRRNLALVALAAAGNAPWVVAGALHAGVVPTAIGARAFALHGEGSLPAPLAALGLGGIWNAEVVPPSRTGVAAWVALVVLLVLVALGARTWWRRTPGPGRFLALWLIGYGLALLTWVAPGLVETLGTTVPGAGLIRDGTRTLALCLPLLVGTAALGAERLVRGVHDVLDVPASLVAVLVCVIFPVTTMTDVAWGIGGALRPVDFPSGWSQARSVLAAAERQARGDVLVLPFTPYRAPGWNAGRKVFDPLGRYLTPDYLASDRLGVSGTTLPGDDPRVPRIASGLDQLDRSSLTRLLLSEGIQYVVVDTGVRPVAGRPTTLPEGQFLPAGREIRVLEIAGDATRRTHPAVWWTTLTAAWTAWLGLLLLAATRGGVRITRKIRSRTSQTDNVRDA